MLLALVIPCLICPNPTWQDLTRRVDHVTIRRSLDSGSTVPPGPDLVSEAFHLMSLIGHPSLFSGMARSLV